MPVRRLSAAWLAGPTSCSAASTAWCHLRSSARASPSFTKRSACIAVCVSRRLGRRRRRAGVARSSLVPVMSAVQGLQWVPSAYLLTYGGFMLLGGHAADLLGRRRILVAGTLVIGVSSLVGGFAGSAGVLVGARLVQGLGAALLLPAALSILTTTFKEGKDRHTAVGAWGA